MKKRLPKPGLRPVRTFPYLKLQYWDERIGAWKDIQRKFGNREALLQYAKDHIRSDRLIRIMLVEDRKSRRVLENLGRLRDFGE